MVQDYAKDLALDDAGLAAFRTLWGEVKKDSTGMAGASSVANFLGTSGLTAAQIKEIQGVADSQAPRGKLNELEFMTALKLVSLVQLGQAADPDLLSVPCDLPAVGSLRGASV